MTFVLVVGLVVGFGAYLVGLFTGSSHDSKLAGRCEAVMWGGVVVAAAAGLIKLAEVLL